MVSLNATVFPDEAYVLVEADWLNTFFRDGFGRVEVDTWGDPDIGATYVLAAGTQANFDVNGTQGTVTHTAVNTTNFMISPVTAADGNFTGQFTSTTPPTGDNFEISFFVRFTDLNNYIRAIVFLLPAGGASCVIEHAQGGVFTNSSFVAVAGVGNSGVYGFRLVYNGAAILFRCWNMTAVEPLTWSNSFTATLLSAGGVGIGTRVAAGVTNVPPIAFSFDDLWAYDPNAVCPQYAGVTRRNTVTGEVVTLRPYISFDANGNLLLDCCQGLWWDTEPPLDVPLEYCATASDIDSAISVNCCFEGGITAPWVASGGVLTSSTAFAHEGFSSGLLTPSGTASQPSIAQALPLLAAGKPVTMSAWIMSPQGYNGVLMRMSVFYSDGKTEVIDGPVEILDDGEWRFLTMTFTPRLNASATLRVSTTGTPPNTTLFYIDQAVATQPAASSATACETVTVPGEGNFWLKSPLHPCDDIQVGMCSPMVGDCEEDSRVSFASMSNETYGANTVLMQPVNRRRPIPVNRVRRDVEATLRLIAHDCDARDDILAANEPGDPLLWQAPAIYCTPDRYMSVGILDDSRISIDHREPFRLVALPHVAVDRPQGPADGVCGARIIDLCDIYTSWAALALANLTWTDLLLGAASPDGPGQPDPPEGARTWGDVEAEFANWLAVEGGGTRDWGELRDGL
jgi:hypothetical protein